MAVQRDLLAGAGETAEAGEFPRGSVEVRPHPAACSRHSACLHAEGLKDRAPGAEGGAAVGRRARGPGGGRAGAAGGVVCGAEGGGAGLRAGGRPWREAVASDLPQRRALWLHGVSGPGVGALGCVQDRKETVRGLVGAGLGRWPEKGGN